MPFSDPLREFYDACNRTELYQLCVRAGLMVSPAAPHEKMVSYLLGEEHPPAEEHPVHVWRNGLIGLIQDYWTGIEAQLRCPAKELGPPAREGDPPKPDPSDPKSPLACYRCVDTRVVSCLVENEAHEGLIQLHRKMTVQPRKEADMGTTGMLTLDTAPRTLEGMSMGDGVNRGQLKRLFLALVNEGAVAGDEKAMVAFVDLDTDAQRKVVLEGLLKYDQTKGKAPQGTVVPAPQAPGAPAPTPVVSAAPAGAAAPAGEPPRTPSNRGKRSAAPAAPAEGAPAPEGAPANIGEAIVSHLELIREGLGGVKLMLESVLTQVGHVGQIVTTVEQDKSAAQRHAQLLDAIRELDKSVKLSAAITLWQIENASDTPPSAVLSEAATYIAILDKALAGKAG